MTTTVVWHPACRHHEAVDAALDGWRPELLLVSAGFDSLAGDPLGGFTLQPGDMAHWTTALRERMGRRRWWVSSRAATGSTASPRARAPTYARLPERTAFPILQA